jgi:hypothetical protein
VGQGVYGKQVWKGSGYAQVVPAHLQSGLKFLEDWDNGCAQFPSDGDLPIISNSLKGVVICTSSCTEQEKVESCAIQTQNEVGLERSGKMDGRYYGKHAVRYHYPSCGKASGSQR